MTTKLRLTRRDVERPVVLELHEHREAGGGAVGEVQAQPGGWITSGLPEGCRCRFSTRSVDGSTRQAMSAGSATAAVPGFQNRKWLSGSKLGDSSSTSMPAKPGPGSRASCRRAEPVRSTSTFAWWTTLLSPGRSSIART